MIGYVMRTINWTEGIILDIQHLLLRKLTCSFFRQQKVEDKREQCKASDHVILFYWLLIIKFQLNKNKLLHQPKNKSYDWDPSICPLPLNT